MAHLKIVEFDYSVVVKTEYSVSTLEQAISAVATSVVTGMAVSLVGGVLVSLTMGALAGACSILVLPRTRRFELQVTKDEFVARGKVGDNPGRTRSVRTKNIKWLEFQEDTTGPETAHHPGGLYAVLSNGAVCLLPDVDEQQTVSVIERIKGKFPELDAQWRSCSPFGKRFISLGLSDEL